MKSATIEHLIRTRPSRTAARYSKVSPHLQSSPGFETPNPVAQLRSTHSGLCKKGGIWKREAPAFPRRPNVNQAILQLFPSLPRRLKRKASNSAHSALPTRGTLNIRGRSSFAAFPCLSVSAPAWCLLLVDLGCLTAGNNVVGPFFFRLSHQQGYETFPVAGHQHTLSSLCLSQHSAAARDWAECR